MTCSQLDQPAEGKTAPFRKSRLQDMMLEKSNREINFSDGWTEGNSFTGPCRQLEEKLHIVSLIRSGHSSGTKTKSVSKSRHRRKQAVFLSFCNSSRQRFICTHRGRGRRKKGVDKRQLKPSPSCLWWQRARHYIRLCLTFKHSPGAENGRAGFYG